VEAHPGPDVPDVRRGLHGGATQVQRCLPGLDRGELALGARCCVIEAERHAAKATAAGTRHRSIYGLPANPACPPTSQPPPPRAPPLGPAPRRPPPPAAGSDHIR